MNAVEEHLPVLREFVAAVQERDADTISACLHYTPPGTLALIAAEWISQLLAEAEERELERLRAARQQTESGDLWQAYQVAHKKRLEAEARLADSRATNAELQDKLAAVMQQRREAA